MGAAQLVWLDSRHHIAVIYFAHHSLIRLSSSFARYW